MYTVVLYQNWFRNFYRSISIGPPSKLYEDNQETIKIFLVDIITPQARPPSVLITDLQKHHTQNTFEMVNTRSNMYLADLKSKPHGGKGLRDVIDLVVVLCYYPAQGSEHYNLLCPEMFHGSIHVNDNNSKNNVKKTTGFVECAPSQMRR